MALQEAVFVMMLYNVSIPHPNDQVNVQDSIECAVSCFSSRWCNGISYSEHHHICQKSDFRHALFINSLTQEPGWQYYQLHSDNCPLDYVLIREPVQLCFKVFNKNDMFPEEAKDYCHDNGGSLITLNSEEKIIYMNNYLTDIGANGNYFIGCEGSLSAGSWIWKWPDDSTVTDNNWNSSEPDMLGHEIYTVMIANYQYKWANIGNHSKYFICENQI